MVTFISHQSRRVSHALRGLCYALFHDVSFRLQVTGGSVAIGIFYYFFQPFTQVEILFLSLGWMLILITELQNSSFEEALDKLHPELHESIGRSKDMASGAVLIAGMFMLFVMVAIALW